MPNQHGEFLKRKVIAYQADFEQWEQERKAFIIRHGLAAWDTKVEQEIKELYPDMEMGV